MSLIDQIANESTTCIHCPICNYNAPDITQFNIHKRGPRHIEKIERIIQNKRNETRRIDIQTKYNNACIKLKEYEDTNQRDLDKTSIEYLKLINEKNSYHKELINFDILYIQDLLL